MPLKVLYIYIYFIFFVITLYFKKSMLSERLCARGTVSSQFEAAHSLLINMPILMASDIVQHPQEALACFFCFFPTVTIKESALTCSSRLM